MSQNGGDEMSLETEYATLDAEMLEHDTLPRESSIYSCPACGGVLWEQSESVESALWAAHRALQERAQLSDRLARRVGSAGANHSRARFETFAREAREHPGVVRPLPAADGPAPDTPDRAPPRPP